MKQKILDFLWAHKWWVGGVVGALGLFLVGYYEGSHHHIPAQIETHVVTDTVSAQLLQQSLKREESLQQQLVIAQKTITDLKVSKTVVVHDVKHKDGSETIDTTTKTDTTKTVDNTVDTHKDTTDTTKTVADTTNAVTTTTHTDTHTLVKPLTKDHWYIGAGLGMEFSRPNGAFTVGPLTPELEFRARVAESPFWIGARLGADVTLVNPHITAVRPTVTAGFSF